MNTWKDVIGERKHVKGGVCVKYNSGFFWSTAHTAIYTKGHATTTKGGQNYPRPQKEYCSLHSKQQAENSHCRLWTDSGGVWGVWLASQQSTQANSWPALPAKPQNNRHLALQGQGKVKVQDDLSSQKGPIGLAHLTPKQAPCSTRSGKGQSSRWP